MGGFATRSRLAAVGIVGVLAAGAPSAFASPHVEVVAGLSQPSLVAFARGHRTLQGYGHSRRVLASAFGSRLYLARLRREQSVVARRIERVLPGARVRRHYTTVLDGLSVVLRPGQIHALHRVEGIDAVYPNLRYHPLTDTVPEVIGAPGLWGSNLVGAGAGIKVAVVDDGIDARHPFFAPRGLVAPPGFPKGARSYTTGKVIVARAFAPPDAARRDRLPFDAEVSRHATHVAGILAGDQGLTAPGDAGRPTVTGLSGVAPRAWLGNYRALALPDPVYGSIGSTADLVAAVDAAVNDGMDVINLSIGGTEIDPASDGLVRAVQGAVAAGVVVVIAAGNERELLGYGSIDSPGAAQGAITVAATSSSRFFARSSSITGSDPVPPMLRSFGVAVPDSDHAPRRVAGPIVAASSVGDPRLCSRRAAGALSGMIALADRGGCSVLRKARVARAAGATAVLVPPFDAGPPVPEIDRTAVPVLVAPAPVVTALETYLQPGATAALAVRTATREEATLPGVVATFSSAGPTPFEQQLKPDLAAPGVAILSSVPDSSSNEPGDWAIFDGTSMSTPAVAGAAALLLEAHPSWAPGDVKAALMATAHPAFVDAAGLREASPLTAGAGFVDVSAANAPGVVADPPSLSFGEIAPGGMGSINLSVRDLGGGAGDWMVSTRFVGPIPDGVNVTVPTLVTVPEGGSGAITVQVSVTPTAPDHEGSGVLELVQGPRVRRVPFWLRVDRPLLVNKPFQTLRAFTSRAGDTRGAGEVASVYRYPTNVSPLGLPPRFDGPEQLWRFQLGQGAVNVGVSIETASGVVAYPILMTQRDESHVAGESGLPLNVGPLPSRTSIVPAAGIDAPAAGTWWVAVESPPGKAGRYRIRLWVSDVTAPQIHVLGQAFEHGGRILRLHIVDTGSGVNPGGVTVAGGGMEHRPVDFDEATGVGTIDLSRLAPGRHSLRIRAADLAETKDVLSASAGAANTASRTVQVVIPRKLPTVLTP
jgi:minor extracellular serine protease Vpr